jgi:hypothetical protein
MFTRLCSLSVRGSTIPFYALGERTERVGRGFVDASSMTRVASGQSINAGAGATSSFAADTLFSGGTTAGGQRGAAGRVPVGTDRKQLQLHGVQPDAGRAVDGAAPLCGDRQRDRGGTARFQCRGERRQSAQQLRHLRPGGRQGDRGHRAAVHRDGGQPWGAFARVGHKRLVRKLPLELQLGVRREKTAVPAPLRETSLSSAHPKSEG